MILAGLIYNWPGCEGADGCIENAVCYIIGSGDDGCFRLAGGCLLQ